MVGRRRRSCVPKAIARWSVYLLLGAIVNVAVAWGFALFIDGLPIAAAPFRFGVSYRVAPAWDIHRIHEHPGSTVIEFSSIDVIWGMLLPLELNADRGAIDEWVSKSAALQRGELLPREPETDAAVVKLPPWSRAREAPREGQVSAIRLREDARGWPLRSLVSYLDSTIDLRAKTTTPIRSPWHIEMGGTQGPLGLPRRLPMRPIWSGFAINTIFYAAIVWLLFFAPFKLRRWRRIRRGLCPACAYPVGTSDVCTECGKAVKSISREVCPH